MNSNVIFKILSNFYNCCVDDTHRLIEKTVAPEFSREPYLQLARRQFAVLTKANNLRHKLFLEDIVEEDREMDMFCVEYERDKLRLLEERLILMQEFPEISPEEISLHLRLHNALREEDYELAGCLDGKIRG